MRVLVLSRSQLATDRPDHSASQALALLVVKYRSAVIIKRDLGRPALIQLTTDETWKSLKERLRPVLRPTFSTVPPSLNPPSQPDNLNLSYPPKNYESGDTRKRRILWENAVFSDAWVRGGL